MTAPALFFDLGETLVTTPRKWIAGARDTLAALGARGVRLGVVSNTGGLDRAALAAHLPADFDFATFDPALVLLSSEVGIEKPDPRIFELARARAGADATALFCTEDLAHCIVAQQAGLIVLRVQGDVGQLVAALDSTDVLAE
jgi:FMN phosphatase YigB (HAD superfamily)